MTAAADTSTRVRPAALRRRRGELRFGLGMVLPAAIVVIVLLGYPMGYAIYMSGWDWNDKLGVLPQPVGLGNYAQAFGDPQVGHALLRTLVFSAITVLGGVALALGIAHLLNKRFRGRTLMRVLLLVPWAVPPVVNGIIWKLIFDGSTGVVNAVLMGLHLTDHRIQWLASSGTAMGVLIFAELWKLLPFLVLLMLAALQNVPSSVDRAALIDGARGWRKFAHVTFPSIRTTVMFALIVQSMWSLKVFDTIYVLTGGSGGPAEGTTTLNFLAYLVTFSNLDRGYGAALAVGTMVLVLLVTLLWIALLGRRDRQVAR